MKTMINIIFCLMIGILSCKSQSYLNYIPYYMDISVTTHIIDSLQKKETSDFVIFETIMKNDVYDEQIIKKDSAEVAYLIWDENETTKIILITDSCIFQNTNIIYPSSIFSYPYLDQLWLRKEEDIYQFIFPYNSPIGKDIVIYINNKFNHVKDGFGTMFYEYGNNVSFQLDKKRDRYRVNYINLLKSLVLNSCIKWMKIQNYERKGFEELFIEDEY